MSSNIRKTTRATVRASAFNAGGVPIIACFNKATIALGVDFDKLIAALQTYVDKYLAPVWGTPIKLVKASDFIRGAWAMTFLDDADVADALAYHDVTPEGLPLSNVFVKTTLAAGDTVGMSASHELAEMLVDPACNLLALGPDGKAAYAYENCDPVEETGFAVNGIKLSNFVYPSWFEGFRKPKSAKFDQMGLVDRPFKLLKGGYQSILKNGKWSEVYGSVAKSKRFAKEDRRGHRSEYRSEARAKAA
jgi:hypothetical protein